MGTACSSGEPASEGPRADEEFEEIVYLVRQHTVRRADGGVEVRVTEGMGQVMDYRRYVPGARIEVKNLATGQVRNLLEGDEYAQADVVGLDLSFDARRITFSMRRGGDDRYYHVYTANLSPNDGPNGLDYGIRQLTFGDRDDLQPIFIAGGKIAFVTNQPYTEMGTRADEYNHGRDVTQLATISAEGGDADRKLCSQNLSHTVNLFAMQSGKIGYSRWEHLENINDLKVFAANPDCTKMVAVAGQHDKFWNSLVQVQETPEQNVFVGIATSRENTIHAGALMRVDVRADTDPTLLDKENPDYEVLTPGVPLDEAPAPLNVGRYRQPYVLPDGRILVSWARGFVNDLDELSQSPPDFGLYIYNAESGRNELIANYEDSWELYGRPIVARTEPPILSSAQTSDDVSQPTRIGSVDIERTSLFSLHDNTVSGAQYERTPLDRALRDAVSVRIIEGFSSEAAPGVTMFGLTMAEGAALLGEAPILEDGSWLADIPPYLPVHLQPIDEFDLMIRNQTTWIQGMPGESRVCGGCHERRTEAFAPGDGALTLAAAAPADFTQPISERVEYPWDNAEGEPTEIQALLTQKCASCHNESTNGDVPQETYSISMTDPETEEVTEYEVPRLDLSGRPITVEYDMDVETFPASYVSLFYPAAMEMEMGMGAELQGSVPPVWARPSDARNSALIEKINVPSRLAPERTAWPLGEAFSNPNIRGAERTLHPEDVGVELTRDERVMLIRAIDMGGQYYSRKNTGFEPMNPGQ